MTLKTPRALGSINFGYLGNIGPRRHHTRPGLTSGCEPPLSHRSGGGRMSRPLPAHTFRKKRRRALHCGLAYGQDDGHQERKERGSTFRGWICHGFFCGVCHRSPFGAGGGRRHAASSFGGAGLLLGAGFGQTPMGPEYGRIPRPLIDMGRSKNPRFCHCIYIVKKPIAHQVER